jgi:uncharacterized membrane protein YkoI
MRNQRIPARLFIGLLVLVSGRVFADGFKTIKTRVAVETCRETVLAEHPGRIVKLEFKTERRTPLYEFEVLGADGITWELDCDAFEGKIVQVAREVPSVEDPLFKVKAKISEQEARTIALRAHPGTVLEMEYEIEANGDASYEIDIRSGEGMEIKLEVDAASGAIVEDNQQEWYQIGQE